ncbi:anthranilate phosphoribosyltransferase [Thalassiella azotivora]
MTSPEAARSFPQLVSTLLQGQDLAADETAWVMDRVMAGEATPVQVAGFLVALRAKGETVDELRGLVEAMLGNAVRIEVPGPTVDIVGSGGDRANTVNISTMASLVVAGAGERVVKHGNRAASSACGSADVLEALGVRLDLPPERVQALATEVGITFCFATVFHPAMRHAAVPRRELGVATAFNFLGPLTNPAQPQASAIGVADRRMAPLVAGVLAARGTSALVFRGDDGLDELTLSGTSTVWWVRAGEVSREVLDPADLGLDRADVEALRGGDAAHNSAVARALLAGERGPVRDAVLLNAAAALVAAGRGSGELVERMAQGLQDAARAVDSGAAADVLDRWVVATGGQVG